MAVRGKGLLFIFFVLSFIIGSPLLLNSSSSAQAMDYEVSGFLKPVDDLSSVYFIGMYTDYSGDKGYFYSILNDAFPAEAETNFSFTASYDGNSPIAYTILASHDVLNNGVTVGSNTIMTGTTWDSLFYHDGVDPSYTQETFAALLVGSYIHLYLMEFYAYNASLLGAPMGSDLTLVNFSTASFGGSAYASVPSVSPVPEPATLLLLGPSLIGLAILRKRFKK